MEKIKLTVNEYAKEFKTSVQSVYQRIKRGSLKCVEENGIKYVVVEDESIKPSLNPNVENGFKEVFKIVERLQRQIKEKDKEIKRLTKQLDKCHKKNEKVYLSYIAELKYLQLNPPETSSPKEEEIIDIKKKKKKKRR
jgi:predicted DNA-binding protein YlxM (UPF0122 family)